MAYSRDPFLGTTERDWSERLERERERETSKIQEMDLWQMAQMSQRYLKIARDSQRQLEIARECQRQLEIARDSQRQLEIARDSQRQLELARDSQRESQRDLERARESQRELERARESQRQRQRGDMELFRQLDDRQTDKQTNGRTELFLMSLSRLKNTFKWTNKTLQ